MAKTVKPAADDAAETVDDAADDTATPEGGPDPEDFLAQIEARAHKGAAAGFKESMDSWLKDTDLEENATDGKGPGPGGVGGEPGGRQRGPALTDPSPFRSVVKEAIELAFGKPRPKRT